MLLTRPCRGRFLCILPSCRLNPRHCHRCLLVRCRSSFAFIAATAVSGSLFVNPSPPSCCHHSVLRLSSPRIHSRCSLVPCLQPPPLASHSHCRCCFPSALIVAAVRPLRSSFIAVVAHPLIHCHHSSSVPSTATTTARPFATAVVTTPFKIYLNRNASHIQSKINTSIVL